MSSDQKDEPIIFEFSDSERLCKRLIGRVPSCQETATCQVQRAFGPGRL